MLPRIFGPRSIGSPLPPEVTAAPPLIAPSIRRQHDALRGILLMCACVAMFPFMNAAVKLLGQHYPVTQIVWARFTGHLVVMLLVFLPQYGRQFPRSVDLDRRRGHHRLGPLHRAARAAAPARPLTGRLTDGGGDGFHDSRRAARIEGAHRAFRA
jgi:hypothetical protein